MLPGLGGLKVARQVRFTTHKSRNNLINSRMDAKDVIPDEAITARLLWFFKPTVCSDLIWRHAPFSARRAGGIDRFVHSLLGLRHVPNHLLFGVQIAS